MRTSCLTHLSSAPLSASIEDFVDRLLHAAQILIFCEISGSHGVEYEDESLLSIIALMMEAVRTSDMSAYSNEITLGYIQEDSNLHLNLLCSKW
jgi:hypothetical protein